VAAKLQLSLFINIIILISPLDHITTTKEGLLSSSAPTFVVCVGTVSIPGLKSEPHVLLGDEDTRPVRFYGR